MSNRWLKALCRAYVMLVVCLPLPGRADSLAGPLTVGSERNFPPYADVDSENRATGFSVELFAAVAKNQDLPVRFVLGDWNAVWTDLVEGKIDALPLVARLPSREGLVEFTRPHTYAYDTFFRRKGSAPIRNIEEARPFSIIVLRSDAAHHALTSRGFAAQLRPVDTLADGMRLLASGEHDALLAPHVLGIRLNQTLGLSEAIEHGPLLNEYRREFSFATKKGDWALRDKLEAGLEAVKQSGEYDRLYRKWMDIDEPVTLSRTTVLGVVLGILAAVALLAVWNRALHRLVAKRTADLREHQAHLEQTVEERTAALTASETKYRGLERRYRTYLELTNEWTWVTDAAGMVTEDLPGLRRFTGMSLEHILGAAWLETLHPDDRQNAAAVWNQAVAEKSPYETNFRMRRHDGEYRWVLTRGVPIFDDRGEIVEWAGSCLDITERKQVGDALRESEERFRLFMDNSPGIAWIKDEEGRFVYLSRTFEQRFGVTLDAWRGRTDHDVWPADIARAFRDNDLAVLRDGQSRQVIEQARIADSLPSWWLISKFLIVDAAGRRYVAGTGVDITASKQAEEALREADRRKDEFLATLAHELRNPLAPIRNVMHLFRQQGQRDPALRTAQDMVERQLDHMVRLVDDLLDVSRITHGRLQLRRERVALATVLTHAVESSRPHLDQAEHELTISLPPEPIHLDADPVRLMQVFQNLLHNACKYTEPGGRVGITAGLDGGEIVVTVSDNGIGIPPERLPDLFEMFSQIGVAQERAQGGLGIGLALTRGLVRMHDGRIEVRSGGAGKGSAFSVRLPAVAGTSPPVGESGETQFKPKAGLRILVIDDDRDVADSLAMVLRIDGFEVETAYGGHEGIDAALRFNPDIILLDIGMPRLDGYGTCRRIRELSGARPPRIVAVTGWGQENDRRRVKEAGFDGHLVKPVPVSAVLALLATVPR